MPRSLIKFLAALLLIFIVDSAVLAAVYFSLPNPRKLLTGTPLERVTKDDHSFRFVAGPKNKKYVALNQIPRLLPNAIIFLEDGKFYQHFGFDLDQIENAIYNKIYNGKKLRGASTLSQQLVKNLYLSPERTFRRKMLEALITIKMEMLLSKPKIMELYLNSIDWGKGLFGIAEAAQFYFQKRPKDLDLRECIFLAAIIPNPARFSQLDEELLPKRFVRMQMIRAFEGLYHAGYITLSEYEEVVRRPFGNRKEPDFDEEGQPQIVGGEAIHDPAPPPPADIPIIKD